MGSLFKNNDPHNISIRGEVESIILVAILLGGAAVTGWVIANVSLPTIILIVLWILEITTVLAAINKLLPFLITTIGLLHRVFVSIIETVQDILSRVERRKIRIVLENESQEFEFPISIEKDELVELEKLGEILNLALEKAKSITPIANENQNE